MAQLGAFEVEGVIVQQLGKGIYRAELANGHRFFAFVAGKAKATFPDLAAGQKVWCEFSPCDLSKARILIGRMKPEKSF